MSAAVCSHLDTIEVTAIPDPVVGCEERLKIGSLWVHLRMCVECGKGRPATPRRTLPAVCTRGPGRVASCRARGEGHIVFVTIRGVTGVDIGALAALEHEV